MNELSILMKLERNITPSGSDDPTRSEQYLRTAPITAELPPRTWQEPLQLALDDTQQSNLRYG